MIGPPGRPRADPPAAPARILDRLLSRLGDPDAGADAGRVRAFGRLFALVLLAEHATKALAAGPAADAADLVSLAAVTPLAALVVAGRLRRRAFAGLALVQLAAIVRGFPLAGNHRYLEVMIAILFASLDGEREDERRLLLSSLRWVMVVVLFFSGVQKLAHGYYFRGQFLAWSLWREPFLAALGPLLPGAERARLLSYGMNDGDGPYLVGSPAFVALSNAVWILEIALPPLLVARRTRPVAWIAACAFVAATQVVARELMFGVEFAGGLLLFAGPRVLPRVWIPAALLLGASLLVRLGVFPPVTFH